MARFLFPDEGSRLAYQVNGASFRAVAGQDAIVYTDSTGDTLADLRIYEGTNIPGLPISKSSLELDRYSRLPLFWGPDGVDTVYVRVGDSTGPISPVYARMDDRIDTLVTAVAANASGVANAQPLDADLTAIAALTTTAYGRALLTLADASAVIAALGLGTAATQNTGAFDAAGAATAAQAAAATDATTKASAAQAAAIAASQPVDSDLTAIAALTTTTFGRALLAQADAPTTRTTLGLGTASTQAKEVFAPIQGQRPGNRVVVLGASIENLSSFVISNSESFGKDWPTFAMLLSNGRFNLIRNMAIGGQTTDQFIARFDTDVTPSAPNLVPLGSIENDVQLGYSQGKTIPQMAALWKANIRTLTAKCRAIGAVPIWRTAMPHASTAVHTAHATYNAWLKEYCAQEGLPCLDFWTVLVDPTTGLYRVGLTAEPGAGIHPNEAGAYLLAQYWLEQMDAYLPPGAIPLPQSANDVGQLLPTPLFTAGSAGTPTGWNAIGGSPSGVTRSLVADPLGYGQLVRHAHAGSTVSIQTQTGSSNITPTQASVGDVLEISGRINSDGGTSATVIVTFTTDGTSPSLSRVPVSIITHALDNGTYKQIMPPIGVGFLRCQVTLQSGNAPGPNTGVVDFSYPVVRNLTREGSWPI